LKQKAEESGCHVHEVPEHYTSKTCGKCGRLHWNLGKSEVFKCPFCGWTMDRDFNGARNIFIMNIETSIGHVIPLSFMEEGAELLP
jgi:putative transposase